METKGQQAATKEQQPVQPQSLTPEQAQQILAQMMQAQTSQTQMMPQMPMQQPMMQPGMMPQMPMMSQAQPVENAFTSLTFKLAVPFNGQICWIEAVLNGEVIKSPQDLYNVLEPWFQWGMLHLAWSKQQGGGQNPNPYNNRGNRR